MSLFFFCFFFFFWQNLSRSLNSAENATSEKNWASMPESTRSASLLSFHGWTFCASEATVVTVGRYPLWFPPTQLGSVRFPLYETPPIQDAHPDVSVQAQSVQWNQQFLKHGLGNTRKSPLRNYCTCEWKLAKGPEAFADFDLWALAKPLATCFWNSESTCKSILTCRVVLSPFTS